MAASTKDEVTRDVRDSLLKALKKVNRPGDFCTSGDRPVTMPGLEVDGIGTIGLPLTKAQARRLTKHCRQAPYGKGTETFVDTDVRRVWELDPEQFQLRNRQWDAFVDSLVADVKQELGLEQRKLAAHLYKLLVYEKGSFFLPHRDGEKLDGMVATLVIGLPAVHEGGELIVSHDGRTATIVLAGAASGQELSYAAFYADCEHEVRPVRSGYRLCLAYNLTLETTRRQKRIGAPAYRATVETIGEQLSDWGHEDAPYKLAVLLDHQYTQDGLTLDRLKGIDRSRADVLFEAAEQAGCIAHLALVTLWQNGSAEGGYDPYDWRHRRRSRWSDDDDDYEDSAGEYEMGEIYDWSLSADHWSDRDGKKVALGEINIDESEVVSETPLDQQEHSREDFEGFTGNAGMTLERWYHRAAIVIWPQVRHFDALCTAGTDASIGGLQVMVRKLKRAAKSRREALRQECLRFAHAIIESWEVGCRFRWSATYEAVEPIDRGIFLAKLCDLDDADLVRKFLSQVVPQDGDVQLDGMFFKFCMQHGWQRFVPELVEIVQAATGETIPRNVNLVQLLCTRRNRNAGRLEIGNRLCEQTVSALIEFDQSEQSNHWSVRALDRAETLTSLVKAMLAVNAGEPLQQLIDHTLAAPEKYDLTDAHLAAIFKLEAPLKKLSAPNAAVSRWIRACEQELIDRTAQTPQPPADFRRDHRLSCDCQDCRTLSEFLDDPDREQLRLPVAQSRRQHLHQIIERQHPDTTHVTERRGRPYTLVCTKTTAFYEAVCKVHNRDLKNLERLRELTTAISGRT